MRAHRSPRRRDESQSSAGRDGHLLLCLGVNGNDRRTCLKDGECRKEPVDSTCGHDRHPVTRVDTTGNEARGEIATAIVDLLPGHRSPTMRDWELVRLCMRRLVGAPFQQLHKIGWANLWLTEHRSHLLSVECLIVLYEVVNELPLEVGYKITISFYRFFSY